MTLPPPPGSPDPNGSLYFTDEDISSTSETPDDYPPPHSPFSTSGTQRSWSAELETYPGWPAQDSFHPVSAAPNIARVIPTQVPQATSSQLWSWPVTAMSPPPMMPFPAHQGYFNIPDPPNHPAYNVYGGPPAMLSPSPSQLPGTYGRGPTSSPVARGVGSAPYLDARAMPQSVRYTVQREPFFQY